MKKKKNNKKKKNKKKKHLGVFSVHFYFGRDQTKCTYQVI